MMTAVWILLGLAICMAAGRVAYGPTAMDRVLGLDSLGILSLVVLVAVGIQQKEPRYVDIGLVIALIAFTVTVALARYVEDNQQDGALE